VGVSRDPLWELQWHPAGGGRVRRMVVTRASLRRIACALALVALLVLAVLGILPFGLRGFFTRFSMDVAQRENRALLGERQALTERAENLAGVVFARTQRARRAAWSIGAGPALWREPLPRLPKLEAGLEAIVAWLGPASARLDALAQGLATTTPKPPCPLEAVPLALPMGRLRAVPVALFGWRPSPFTGRTTAHHGVTIAAPAGEPVLAAGAGRVVFAGSVRERKANEWTRLGNLVVLDHGSGVFTVYAHLREVAVRRAQSVVRSARIGTVGQTGWTRVPALYYEVRWPLTSASKPIDPALVTVGLPSEDLDARFEDPTGGLPDDFTVLDHLPGRGRAR
jgi:murein DD-endopeptidase MepM/ murein hydrolase activator NlpD